MGGASSKSKQIESEFKNCEVTNVDIMLKKAVNEYMKTYIESMVKETTAICVFKEDVDKFHRDINCNKQIESAKEKFEKTIKENIKDLNTKINDYNAAKKNLDETIKKIFNLNDSDLYHLKKFNNIYDYLLKILDQKNKELNEKLILVREDTAQNAMYTKLESKK